MFEVELQLFGAASFGFADGFLNRTGHFVGIKDNFAVGVAGGAADGLNQRTGRTQKTFLVGVENRHQRTFRNIKTFAQKVDADQNVKHAHS